MPVVIPKNPSGVKGRLIPSEPGGVLIMGYKVKKWGNGAQGNHNAKWRKGRGLAHGMVNGKAKKGEA